MGEPAGVGGEIALKCWLRRGEGVPPFVLVDDPERLAELAWRLDLDVPVRTVESPERAPALFAEALPVLACPLGLKIVPGKPDPAGAGAVRRSIEAAVALVQAGRALAVVTNPIQKRTLYQAGFPFPGHTEFLAELAGIAGRSVMMLACDELRVVPVTGHVSLRRALDELTADAVVDVAAIAEAALRRDFGIARPRLAVAGLNPHAGEGGSLGPEEEEVIRPALRRLEERGIAAVGPLPPDTMFAAHLRGSYDAAVCMYHDQALIPIKAIDFDGAVNVTLGLPFVRTSPDHGTALDIAGSGRASERSLLAALHMAAAMARRRAGSAVAAGQPA
jgi:4-hydroxythreonine-4-phosphate dehydrogenase